VKILKRLLIGSAVKGRSKTPMTNLHLGNARGRVSDLNQWQAIEKTAVRGAALFSESLYVAASHTPVILDPTYSPIVRFLEGS